MWNAVSVTLSVTAGRDVGLPPSIEVICVMTGACVPQVVTPMLVVVDVLRPLDAAATARTT